MLEAMRVIRDDEELDGKFLVQLCSVDVITRIDVVYHFASLAQNHMFQVKVPADHEAAARRVDRRRCGVAPSCRSARSTT